MSHQDSIVQFFSGGLDAQGRTLAELLSWDDARLEQVHDYIQWMFPTRQPSGVNPFAPLVNDSTIRAFAADPSLRAALTSAFERILTFYGLRRTRDRVEPDGARFAARAAVWLTPGNHNHLRLTRIMESLATLGLRAEALALQRCLLDDVCAGAGAGRVSARTVEFWRRAVPTRTAER